MWVIGFIEGIVYLMKSKVEFRHTYVNGRRGWFWLVESRKIRTHRL